MQRFIGAGLVLGAALVARRALRRAREIDLHDQVALITGSSRGLGLALARELAQHGCRVALCARDRDELERARADLQSRGAEVIAIPCDVTDREQVRSLIAQATAHFGRIDVLINNAGVITVGPLETQTVEDFERSMDVMFWGTLYPTFEVLPQMRARRAGRIANITSIGGKVSVPHLMSYSTAKFATVGLSEGLRAELAQDGIKVTTVVPGLMRTGSHVNAEFKGQNEKEFGMFSVLGVLPLTSLSAEDAARQIVGAIRRGDSEIILGWQATLVARLHGLLPELSSDALGVINRLLPRGGGIGTQRASGFESRRPATNRVLSALGDREPIEKFNQQG